MRAYLLLHYEREHRHRAVDGMPLPGTLSANSSTARAAASASACGAAQQRAQRPAAGAVVVGHLN
jgi:hypothetical protein